MSWIEDFDEPGVRMLVLGRPMHGTTLLVILHCAAMVACALLTACGYAGALHYFVLSRQELLSGHVWQLFTYALVGMPSLSFAIDMLMLYWFGMGLETSLGRPRYFSFYAILILFQSALFLLTANSGYLSLSGLGSVIFGVFIAYATIYPDVQIFFGITVKLIAYALFAIYALSDLAYHNWIGLLFLGSITGLSYCAMRLLGFQGGFDWWDRWTTSLANRHRSPVKPPEGDKIQESINPILDKIASRGINSLTETERLALERARSTLKRKEDEGSSWG